MTLIRLTRPNHEIKSPITESNHQEKSSVESTSSSSVEDLFEQPPTASAAKNKVRYRHVIEDARARWGKPEKEYSKVPWPNWEAVAKESSFKKNPNLTDFLRLTRDFDRAFTIVGHQKFAFVGDINIDFSNVKDEDAQIGYVPKKSLRLEKWHENKREKFAAKEEKSKAKTARRHAAIEEEGPGFPGKMTKKIGKTKAASFYAKNNYTLRGNVFKLTHKAFPRNVYEIMPRFDYRNSAHIGVRVSQFTLTTFLSAIGYALIPVSFGLSKIVTDHTRTAVTLAGETTTFKIAGASKEKIALHAGLRGAQLEIPRLIPIAGDVVNIGESAALGTAAFGIVVTTLADAILYNSTTRYQRTLNVDDLGNSRCLAELNQRIDYLSQFLLPYGQYLLLKETNPDKQMKLRRLLKEKFKLLRSLEKKKLASLNYYLLALLAEKVPAEMHDKIKLDCERALPETRVNTHRIARKCLATLVANDKDLAGKELVNKPWRIERDKLNLS